MRAPEDRQPACVLACPTRARLFGDFDDPGSEVSRLAAARGGFGLLPELGYAPVNRYLPPRQPPPVLGEDDARELLERGLASLASPVIRR
jgi:Fe-S-cluster-containing dehydrogenase component